MISLENYIYIDKTVHLFIRRIEFILKQVIFQNYK